MAQSFNQVAKDMEPFLKGAIDQYDMFLTKFEQVVDTKNPRLVTTGDSTLSPPPNKSSF